MPLISVVMPVYNAEKYLSQAIGSIVGQTFEDFELLIVDDGSTDASRNIVATFKDPRIVVLGGTKNRGVATCLNEGLEHARSPYVARMDADDVAAPRRLERQLQFLTSHPSIGLCGSWYRTIGSNGRTVAPHKMPGTHARICARALFATPLVHPTVMFSMRHFPKGQPRYSTAAPHAEDYELWERLLTIVEMANVPEYLHSYRVHEHQVSSQFEREQEETARSIRARSLTKWGVPFDSDELEIHSAISTGRHLANGGELRRGRRWLAKLRRCAGWHGRSARALRWECHFREWFL